MRSTNLTSHLVFIPTSPLSFNSPTFTTLCPRACQTPKLDTNRVQTVLDPVGLKLEKFKFQNKKLIVYVSKQVQTQDVQLDELEQATGLLADVFDDDVWAQSGYVLELSTLGISDVLQDDRQFETFKGFQVIVKTDNQIIHGSLMGRDDNDVTISVKGRIKRVRRDDVIEVRLRNATQ